MPDKQVTLIALFKAKEGSEIILEEALRALADLSRAEPGCVGYILHRHEKDPLRLMLFENWKNQAVLDEHMEKPYFKTFAMRVPELLAEPIDVSKWEMIESTCH
jgi:quinol monooxygenase YgiN